MANLRKKPTGFSKWFLTDAGRRLSFYAANTVTSSVLLAHILPHTVCLSYYKDFTRLYRKGFTVPVPDDINKRFEKALDLLQINESDRDLYTPFMACGFDVFSIGTISRFGIHIGLPVNFTYKDVETIEKSKILVNQESVIWDSDAGKQLLNALIIPENAQLYVIATEIKMRSSWKLYLDTLYATLACAFTYIGSYGLNNRLKLHSQTRSVRLVGYSLMAAFNTVNYLVCKDFTQNMYEENIDKELKELSPVFAEGGKQFYAQILERNKALRVLMGKDGESLYTVLGNENYLFRTKHRPIVQRKDFFENDSALEQAHLVS